MENQFLAVYDRQLSDMEKLAISNVCEGIKIEELNPEELDLTQFLRVYLSNEKKYYCYSIEDRKDLFLVVTCDPNPKLLLSLNDDIRRCCGLARYFLGLISDLGDPKQWKWVELENYCHQFTKMTGKISKFNLWGNYRWDPLELFDEDAVIVQRMMKGWLKNSSIEC